MNTYSQTGFSAPVLHYLSELSPVWAMEPGSIQPWLQALDTQSKANTEPKPLTLQRDGKVAVLELRGAIVPTAPWWSSTTAAMDKWLPLLKQVGADPDIKSLVIKCDSPGGNILGVPETAQWVSQLSEQKPIITFVAGRMCSAAVWLCSGSSMIVAGEGTIHGSVGAVYDGLDYTGMMAKLGIKEWSVTSKNAPLKRISPTEPKGRAVLQAIVDESEALMLEHVAQGRETTVANVTKNFGKGAVMGARAALAAGMIDGIGTWDEVMTLAGGGQVEWLQDQEQI